VIVPVFIAFPAATSRNWSADCASPLRIIAGSWSVMRMGSFRRAGFGSEKLDGS
jgi:hypothetical protein